MSWFSALPTSLMPSARYEKMVAAFGGSGYYVRTPEEIGNAIADAMRNKSKLSIINVAINPMAYKKPQVHIHKFISHSYKPERVKFEV